MGLQRQIRGHGSVLIEVKLMYGEHDENNWR